MNKIFISEKIINENVMALAILNLDSIIYAIQNLIGMVKASPTFQRFSSPIETPDLTAKIEEFESRRDVLQMKYDMLRDEEGREDEKRELTDEIIQLKNDIQSTLDDPADLGDLDDDSDVGYADDRSEETDYSGDIDDGEGYYNEPEDDKMNFGDLVNEYSSRAQQKWRDWFERRCKGQTEGRENGRCRAQGVDYAIREIMAGVSKCSNTSDPNGCRRSFEKLKREWYKRKSEYYR